MSANGPGGPAEGARVTRRQMFEHGPIASPFAINSIRSLDYVERRHR